MRILSNSDYKLFERLVSLSQKEMKRALTKYLKSTYEEVIIDKDYLVGIGNIPIALVAHMDTVFKFPVSNLYYDPKKDVLWSPEGLGADDRAGIFAILKIIQNGYRPSVIFTTDEELGGIGASMLAELDPCPIPELKYLIELDRRGTNDCVFYDCYCPEFVDYVESFGFCERWGSFSDISFLMPKWKVCGVNLSVGYEDEHSYSEILSVGPLFDTIRKVENMLSVETIPDFEYNDLNVITKKACVNDTTEEEYYIYNQCCEKCKKLFFEHELFPVKGLNGEQKMYCPDCLIEENVAWCEECQEAFEVEKNSNVKICKECAENLCMKTSKNNLNQ